MLGAQPLTALASEALVSDSSSQDRKDITDDGPQVQIGDHIAIADTEYEGIYNAWYLYFLRNSLRC